MKSLLTITAAIEAGTGIGLASAPATVVTLLLGPPLVSPSGFVIARILGAALVVIGTVCWVARTDAPNRTVMGLIVAMALYNVAAACVLGYARMSLGMTSVGLLPAVILHSAMAVWCVVCVRSMQKLRAPSQK